MTLPRIIILEALKGAIQSQVPAVNGVPAFKVRHHRFRDTTLEEMPCIAIRYVGDDAPNVTRGTDADLSLAESIMELRVELVIDCALPIDRDRDTAGDVDDGADPTGLAEASFLVETALSAIFTKGEEINTLGGAIWDARYDGSGDNDDVENGENVRLAEQLTLVYRTRAEAPHELLYGE